MNKSEEIKQRYGDPFAVAQALERAGREGWDALTEDDLFMCKWLGLYTHRFEQGYFMLRTKHPGGLVTPEQLDVVASIAERNTKGFVDITTRQDFQFHWVHYADALAVLARLREAGISTLGACGDIPRNVVGCPVAGLDRDELIDASPYVRQVHEFFLGNREYADLPRKYKISISGCWSWCCHPEIQCVALVPAVKRREGGEDVGFDVRVGGGLSTQAFVSQRLGVFVRPDAVLEHIRHATDIWRDSPEYREKRHHARFKYLIHDWGVDRFRQALQERLGRPLEPAPEDYAEPPESFRDHVGVHAQKQPGRYYVGAPVLVGRITSTQLKRAADLCRRYGDGQSVRLTVRQNLLIPNVAEGNVEKVLAALSDIGLSINAHAIRRSVVTCTGIEFCKLAITETKARSRQIVEHLERRVRLEEPLRLHITGCPNACAQYQIGHIGLLGSKTKVDGQVVDAFDIFIGGQMGQGARFNRPLLRKVPAHECAQRLERLLKGYLAKRKAGETFNSWCDRVGEPTLIGLLTAEAAHPLEGIELPPAQTPPSGAEAAAPHDGP